MDAAHVNWMTRLEAELLRYMERFGATETAMELFRSPPPFITTATEGTHVQRRISGR